MVYFGCLCEKLTKLAFHKNNVNRLFQFLSNVWTLLLQVKVRKGKQYAIYNFVVKLSKKIMVVSIFPLHFVWCENVCNSRKEGIWSWIPCIIIRNSITETRACDTSPCLSSLMQFFFRVKGSMKFLFCDMSPMHKRHVTIWKHG